MSYGDHVSVDIYARISDDREGMRKGVDRQLPDCRRFAEQRDVHVAEELVDNDISAARRAGGRAKPRPAYVDLYARIKAGTTTTIIVWHLDRLYRNMRELEELIDLVEATEVRILTVTGGDFDLNHSDGRVMARIVVAINMKESEDKSRRIRRKHLELAEAGLRHGGGYRQFGYIREAGQPDRLHPDEADRIREAARRVLAGETINSVCRDWNAAGVTTATGGQWTQTVLRRILTAASTAGLREHRGVIRPGTWPAILDEPTWRRLRVLLLDPARRRNIVSHRYLLTGFLVCCHCGERMVARPRSNRQRAYVCAKGPGFRGCGRSGSLAEPLEEVVAKLLFRRLDSAAARAALARHLEHDDDDELLAELGADEAALAQLGVDHYAARIVGRGQFVAASQALEAKIEATKRRLRRRPTTTIADEWAGRGDELAARWEAMSVDQQRAVLGAWIETITLGPAVRGRNRFDRDRIRPARGGGIAWRY